MHVAILTFEGFNELDSLIAFGILNHIKRRAGAFQSRVPRRVSDR